ncbi:hypothetical protein L5I01_17355 [Gordonia sp. HY442]|uniref:hypothetical protein n=1 Tax=Gordonia zhenghanii TaxID=2911516 RepID=UPI001F415BF3|nr:hypothetical protein [Gordonia zhenghanii]MCF8605124.1 hypothetical protein [Gordonia zhenghanii]
MKKIDRTNFGVEHNTLAAIVERLKRDGHDQALIDTYERERRIEEMAYLQVCELADLELFPSKNRGAAGLLFADDLLKRGWTPPPELATRVQDIGDTTTKGEHQ